MFSVFTTQVQSLDVSVHAPHLQPAVSHIRVCVMLPALFAGQFRCLVCGSRAIQVHVLPVSTHGPTFALLPLQVIARLCVMEPVWLSGQSSVSVSVLETQTQASRLVVVVVWPEGQTLVVVVVVLPSYPVPQDAGPSDTVSEDGVHSQTPLLETLRQTPASFWLAQR
jgi:hypothetical protein